MIIFWLTEFLKKIAITCVLLLRFFSLLFFFFPFFSFNLLGHGVLFNLVFFMYFPPQYRLLTLLISSALGNFQLLFLQV